MEASNQIVKFLTAQSVFLLKTLHKGEVTHNCDRIVAVRLIRQNFEVVPVAYSPFKLHLRGSQRTKLTTKKALNSSASKNWTGGMGIHIEFNLSSCRQFLESR